MGKYSALGFYIVPPFGRANTATLKLNIPPYCPPYSAKMYIYLTTFPYNYTCRGISTGFTGGYHKYFNMNLDSDAVVYMVLANKMLHDTYPFVITIAEDVSGMPTLCRCVCKNIK